MSGDDERGAILALAAPAAVLLLVLGIVLVGCDGGAAMRAQVEGDLTRVAASVDRLGEDLDSERIQNAALIKSYAGRVARANPKLRELTEVLRQEGTRDGTLYRGLRTRLDEARGMLPQPDASPDAYGPLARELQSLAAAADPTEFNRALSDPLNVLADLSKGGLPRVDAISAGASQRANGAADLGPGKQLVGNPHYGQWRTDGGGNSFWVWYGQFALMRTLLGGPRIGYGAWAGGRDYSYYHDYGRGNYTSPSMRRQQARVASTAQRKFSSEGRTFRSPYARQRTGASTAVTRQKFAAASGGSRVGSASMRGFGSGGYRGPSRGK